MTIVKRLRLLTAIFGAAAACVVIGTVIGDVTSSKPSPVVRSRDGDGPKLIDELAKTKFSDRPALAYKLATGDTAFAWQVKPTLAAAAPRAKDVLVMVDTSASQAGDPLRRAAQIVGTLAKELGADDRVDVWTVNLNSPEHTRSLTGGFKAAADKSVSQASDKLANDEYAAGAVDLKAGVETALKQFERKAGRQQVILYLGDGESAAAAAPLNEAARVELGKLMADRDVQFFAVPLGVTIAANTLHGFGMLTGGTVVRVKEDLVTPGGRHAFTKRLTAAFDVPVLKVDKATLAPAASVDSLFPAQLPPLRADRSTLVVGTVKGDAANLTLTVDGTVAGKKATVTLTERLPASQADNYFVAAMLEQWRTAAAKDAPVVLAGDRALAMASEQFRLYRDEFLVLALDAVTNDRMDHAEKLFAAAANIDPGSTEAKTGAQLIARMRKGEINKKQLMDKVKQDEATGRKQINFQAPPAPAGGAPADQPKVDQDVLLKQAQAAQAVAEADARALVEETLKRVRQTRQTDPDGAYEDLKRQRETIRSLDKLSETVRNRLSADLESAMRDLAVKSGDIKRRAAEERERISRARKFLSDYDQQVSENDRTTARIDRFRFLMNQARYELAYREAQVMEQERVNRGLAVPPEVYATYRIGQSATQLREQREMKRLREDRYLLTMMQVDKSFVPYPDEPPVHFPPASVWRELRTRREIYEFKNQGVEANTPKSLRTLQGILEGTHDIPGVPKRVKFDQGLKGSNLKQMIDLLENQFQKQIKFVVREDLFRALGPDFENIKEKPFQNDANLTGMTLGSFLDVALLDIKASYIVRPEYIEITTMEQRIEEKVTRALEIGDLAFAAPNSINQQALNQNLAVFGAQLQFFGQGVGAAQQFGQLGNQGFGALGQVGGAGGLGALGMAGAGALGALGMAGMGGAGQLGAVGNQGNLGVGGGVLGVTGGQLGQFGNLGGQFGIQGNNQSSVLIRVIAQLVARGEWDVNYAGVGGGPPRNPDDEAPTFLLKPTQLNSLGYYPVANALIVRATGRYHPSQSFKLPIAQGGGVMQGPDNRDRRANADPNVQDKLRADAKPELRNPAMDADAVVKKAGKDPKKVWNETFDWAVTDPKLVVDAAEFLFEFKEYQHAAESLKANLRKGHATGAWAYEALTIALQAGQASPAEVERVALSGIDLEPSDPKAFLRAAKAENDLGRADVAINLCKRAADIEPNLPTAYLNALVYADAGKDVNAVKTDVIGWATENLLRRDWPNDGIDYSAEAKSKVEGIVKKLNEADRKGDAAQLAKAVAVEKTRDLVIRLAWQGQADLDLSVTEPSGTTCSATQKRTTGGGVLKSDVLEQETDNRSEVYTAAEAFGGEYKVTVASALGKAIGNKAQIIVTKFAGTDKQEERQYDIDLTSAQPVTFTLDGGSRTDLATVLPENLSEARMQSAGPATLAPTGITGGFGGADATTLDMATNPASAKNTSPLATQRQEVRLPSVSPALPSFRLVGQISAGGDKAVYTASPVFAGKAVDIPMPKVQLLPGSGR